MRTKFLLLGGAGGFVLLLILGVVFAIRAGFQSSDVSAASAAPNVGSPAVAIADRSPESIATDSVQFPRSTRGGEKRGHAIALAPPALQ